MNYVNFIVKIIEKPRQQVFNDEICVTRFIAEVPTTNTEKFEPIIQITFWSGYADNISKYFFIGDYIIIEGYISLRDKNFTEKNLFKTKQIEISVFKVYPFFIY